MNQFGNLMNHDLRRPCFTDMAYEPIQVAAAEPTPQGRGMVESGKHGEKTAAVIRWTYEQEQDDLGPTSSGRRGIK